jgi:hypothetical protein
LERFFRDTGLMPVDAGEEIERRSGAGGVSLGLQAHAHDTVEHQRQEADQCMGADTVWQAMMHRRDLDVGFQDAEAALDVGQALIAGDGLRRREVGRIGKGDTLVVVRIDRLARSLSHLLEVIERLEVKGSFFRSLQDPIDTASPQGKFTLQVLGAAAEFERALIRERTKAGLAAARSQGRVGGNPGLRARDPAVLRKVTLARQDGYMERFGQTAQDWVPHVRRLRPEMPWEDVLRIVNAALPQDRRWTQARLLRAVKAYVRDGFLPETVLGRASRRDTDDRLPAIVAGIKGADPEITLKAICDRLVAMRERTPRGRSSWQPSSVKMLLERAVKLGLL